MPSNYSIKRCLSLSTAAFLFLLILVSGCSTVTQQLGDREEDPTAWNSLYNGPDRRGSTRDTAEPPFEKIWSQKIRPFETFKVYPREQLSVPVIAEDTLYVGSTNKKVYAFDLLSGGMLWKYDAEAPVESTPTVARDLLCFGTSNGYLRCLKRKTGELQWSFQTGSEVISSPLITENSVYFYSSANRIFALDKKSGKEIWSYRRGTFDMVSPRSRTSPALTADNENILQLFADGTLVCLNAFSGKILWEVPAYKPDISSGPFRSTPAIDGDTAFVPGKGQKVQARFIEDGRVLKTYDKLKTRGFLLAGKEGLVIASETEVALASRKSGEIIWKNTPPGKDKGLITEIGLAGETVLVLMNTEKKRFNLDFFTLRHGHIIAMSLADGHVMWHEELSSTLSGGLSSYGGRIALLTDDGYLEVWGR